MFAPHKEVVQAAETFVRSSLISNDASHDYAHVDRVRSLALHIADTESPPPDRLVVELSALFHDVCDYKYIVGSQIPATTAAPTPEIQAKDTIERVLKSTNCDPDVIRRVVFVISNIGFKKTAFMGEADRKSYLSSLTVELKCVQDADYLDAIGAIGIARCFTYSGRTGRPIYDEGWTGQNVARISESDYADRSRGSTVGHFYEKLLTLKERMLTAEGKREAEKRHAVMQSYLETLAREVSPYPSVSATSSTTRFPVIDISSPDYDDVAAQIRAACEEWGAFAVIRHGVPRKVQQNLVKYGKRFFELPHEEKMKIFVGKGGVAWRGYMWKGGEYTHGSVDAKEGLYIGPDHPPTHPRVVAKTPLFGMNQCPDDSIPELRSAIATYIHHTTLLGERIMDLMSHSLGLSDDHLRRTVTLSEPIALVRLFSYPPTTSQSSDTDDGGDSSSGKTTDFGIGPHTDYGLLTMLYQDSPGLEFFHEGSGTWVSAPFPASGEEADNDFVLCNVGDVLDRLTCGRFHSPRHRVLNRNAKARLSVPFFFDPSWDAEMRPLPLGHLPPLSEADQRAAHLRWDETSILKFEGPYSSFLAKKVSKVFAAVLPEEVVAKLETTKGPSTRFQIPIPV